MPLILAIEPDRRQASHLTAMVRGRLRAEFVIGESAEQALAALGDRVPDLVLTTALLSPKDESALAERLRALDGAAAHVQTLTIPVLATPGRGNRSQRAGGVFSALLGDKADDAVVDGCDPAVFAGQCKEYLERAAADRNAALESVDAVETEVSAVADESIEPTTETLEPVSVTFTPEPKPVRALFTSDEDPPQSLMDVVAALAEEEPQPIVPETAPVYSAASAATAAQTDSDDEGSADFDLSAMLDDSSRQQNRHAQADEEAPADVFELDSSLLTTNEPEAALYTPLARPEVRTWPILESLTTVSAAEEDSVAAAAEVPPAPTPAAEEPIEWKDIIEALRRDAQPVTLIRNSADETAASTNAPAPAAANEANASDNDFRTTDTPQAFGRESVQDEWGFFDPDRAGFAALLARLEEITEQDDAASPQRT